MLELSKGQDPLLVALATLQEPLLTLEQDRTRLLLKMFRDVLVSTTSKTGSS